MTFLQFKMTSCVLKLQIVRVIRVAYKKSAHQCVWPVMSGHKLNDCLAFSNVVNRRMFRTNRIFNVNKKKSDEERQEAAVVKKIASFQVIDKKTKETFFDIIDTFEEENPNRRGHVEFIYACLRTMEEFGVEKDLTVYKKLLKIFPEGKLLPKNELQTEFMHYPWHQQCAVDLLQQMEDRGVMPDKEVQVILMDRFGYRSFPMRKFARMMYWMPKFKHASPFPLPNPLPNDTLELAVLAIKRITGVDLQTVVDVYHSRELKDAIDHTWIVSGQSPQQQELIAEHNKNAPLYVDGAFRIWLRKTSIAYFVLRSDAVTPSESPDSSETDDVSNLNVWTVADNSQPDKLILPPSVHEQEDGTYVATCATGTSSRDSLLSWIRFLQLKNPTLRDVPIIFSLKAPSTAVVPVNSSGLRKESQTEEGAT